MKKYKTGGVANPNKKVTVTKQAGSKGVGTTKSVKITSAQKNTKGGVGGGNPKATVSPGSKKK
ncbi:MAG: hypothetical protein EBU90_25850 [Proteobacteria bacterium]|jgi:hypothetical protein|nr:hypothetical protein [Pseudomonadota bacterium]